MKHAYILIALFLFPFFGYAQTLDWFTNVVAGVKSVLAILIPVFIALAFLVFVWGLITFIAASGSDSAKEEGKRRMIWGVLALFVITAIWGILAVLQTITATKSGTRHVPEWTEAPLHVVPEAFV